MTPFATPGLVVLDTLRLLLFAAGFSVIGAYLRSRWPATASTPERARVVGLALALFTIAASRVTNLGQPVSWQLFASIVVFVLVWYSVLAGSPARGGRG